MSTITDFKNRALAQLKGNWTQPVLLVLVYGLIVGGAAGISSFFIYLYGAVLICAIPMMLGVEIILLQFYRGEKEDIIPKIFDPYKNEFSRFLTTGLLVGVYTFLWSLLLYVPCIIKGISYSMTPYILKDHPELKNNAAIELSMAMMEGKKWKFFLLQLSFIGWAILAAIPFGIGVFWLQPYMSVTKAAFYEEIKEEYDSKQAA
ncbi:MAG: DUF975 family protein [Paludibacter sp.]|jgi:uncharacterized membrane protein|nr:DUF975 family protein [Paludibacter sp.]